ncbi:sortase [Candidatus Roizmanbacteria bacterium]|nr:sortase [Candidatus Roizmanbacteria bacterium]
MKSYGIIYQYHEQLTSEILFVAPLESPVHTIPVTYPLVRQRNFAKLFNGLIVGGVIGILVLFVPFLYVEAKYRVNSFTAPKPVIEEEVAPIVVQQPSIRTPTFSRLINEKYLKILQPVDSNFSVVIPKLALNSRVIPQVDSADKTVYTEALTQGAAHARGTALPGEHGRIFVFAHSTDYVWNITRFNAVFYLLKELVPGDEVYAVYNGVVFPYQVVDRVIVEPTDLSYMEPKTGEEELILQTCWPPGTTSQRLLVIAKPKNSMRVN